MSFRGVDFLAVARDLLDLGPGEGRERSSISRSYYAVFHSARDYCISIGGVISENNAHTEVRRCLESRGQEATAQQMRRLHRWRTQSDYDVPTLAINFAETALDALAMADEIITKLDSDS